MALLGEYNTPQIFWKKVLVGGLEECWLWKEGTFSNGYGRFKQNYKSLRAHRVALTLVRGQAPFGRDLALHSCHNKLCCNPLHLRWGTHEENMEDRAARKLPAHNKGVFTGMSSGARWRKRQAHAREERPFIEIASV